MNYYDEIDKNIKVAIDNKEYLDAYRYIKDELSAPYVPKDFEEKLNSYLETIKPYLAVNNSSMNLEDIEKRLFMNEGNQLVAVSELIHLNLRDNLDLVNKFLTSDKGLIDAKVLVVECLIRQEISEEMKMTYNGVEYSFIPKYLLAPEDSDAFIETNNLLQNYYLKEPSKYEIAKDLLYKELLLNLPINLEKEDSNELFKKITSFIDDAFK